jgi:alpha-L-fucosidase
MADGVVNNRFSAPFADFTTPEYAKYDKITPKKWETCRGLGFSFGYNQVEGPEQVIKPDDLIALLVDIVSKNGNLLLNIGPKPDGSISDIQMDRLTKLGAWLETNGDGIFDTKPWVKPSATAADGSDLRFTTKDDALYAYFLKRPQAAECTIAGVREAPGMAITSLGVSQKLSFRQVGNDLKVSVPIHANQSYVSGIRISPVPSAV